MNWAHMAHTSFSNKSSYLHKMTTKPKVRHLIQAHESLRGNFESCGLERQEIYSVKFQQFKVDKRNMLFFVSFPTP